MPKPESIEKLRGGILIREESSIPAAKEKPANKIRTAPAKIHLLKQADNPWFEVTLIEGRNRQIRKMFEEVGHRVEKIRRVRYGPLKLDVEPGKFRMLTQQEVARLKSSADGGKATSTTRPTIGEREHQQRVRSRPS
jgi:23S rRNA pseudouridine2605 synthase